MREPQPEMANRAMSCSVPAPLEAKRVMSFSTIEIIGFVAALLTTGSWVPQALRTLRTRDARAISLSMQLLFSSGTALWLTYGVMISSWPVVLANAVTMALVLAILAMKLRYG